MARRSKPSPSAAPTDDLPVLERRLDNGLLAIVLPRRQAPIVVCDLYYPVGSFDEPPGRTGLAHFVEHMLFKGTERFPKGQIDRLVVLAGGQSNAETAEDSTHYWFAFPSDRWELALAIEADRMRGAQFDPAEVELERRVIAEERARELNSPQGRLDQTHLTLTYIRHPYRNPILGWPEDIAAISVDDLKAFYEAHYSPDQAVLVVVGDVEPKAALDLIASHFADAPARKTPRPRAAFSEPDQSGRREFVLSDAESAARGLFGWRTVPRAHRDAVVLDVIADLLCCGRRSRLWNSLVETDKSVIWIESAHAAAQRAGQFFVQLEAAPGADLGQLERRICDELARLRETGPSADELDRSRRRIKAAWRWEQEDLTTLAAGLGSAALWSDWRDWQTEIRATLTIDTHDIKRVVDTYLIEPGKTVGWSIPGPGGEEAMATPGSVETFADAPRAALLSSAPQGSAAVAHAGATGRDDDATTPIPVVIPRGITRLVDYKPRRTLLENGLRLIFEQRPGTGVVALDLFADAGLLRESKPGLACLTGRLLEEGTAARSATELAALIEDVGGTLESGATGSSLRVCSEDLPLAIELLADVTIRPVFPADAVNWVAERIAAEYRGDLEDPAFRAEMSFRGLVYSDHPLSRDPRGGVREIARLTRQDALDHHHRHFAPENTVLVAVGDFEPRRLLKLVKAHLGSWEPRGLPRLPYPPVAKPGRGRVRRIHHRGEQTHIVLGHLGVARTHPDFDTLVILDHIFGSGPGFCDRLGRIIRDELGLVYTIGGGMTDSADVLPGLFRVHAGTMPEQAERVITTVTEQIRAMYAGAFSDEEVDRARGYLTGAWVFDYQSVEQRAERLLELERWGMSLDEPRRWPERIAAITPRQVRKAARTHLRPEAVCRVELGPPRRRGHRVEAECA
jgi:zinc protease